MTRVLVLNGPNLGRLGRRQPEIYGYTTYAELADLCVGWGSDLGLEVEVRQTNHEGELVSWVQEAPEKASGIVINAGAYTHTSIALHDALLAGELPAIEVHLSNIYKRDTFRHHSYISLAARGVIAGLGAQGYLLALDALAEILANKKDA